MKKIAKVLSCLMIAYSLFAINPFWPCWGNSYTRYYEGGRYINLLPEDYEHFLRTEHWSGFPHVAAIISLPLLYVGFLLAIFSLIVFFVSKGKKTLVLDFFVATTLTLCSVLLCFCHCTETFLYILDVFMPMVGGLLFFALDFVFDGKKERTSLQGGSGVVS